MSTSDHVAVVYANHGRWVAECPREFCFNAEHLGFHQGILGGLEPDAMHCQECATSWPARWPAPALRQGVEQLLSDRPDPRTRNWQPHETLHDLLEQNIEHGIVPQQAMEAAAAGQGGALLTIIGDEITTGRALGAGARLTLPGVR